MAICVLMNIRKKIKLVYHDFMKIVIWDKAKLKSEFIFKKILNNHTADTQVWQKFRI